MTICLTEKVRRIIHTFGTTVEEQALHQFHFLVDGLLINGKSFMPLPEYLVRIYAKANARLQKDRFLGML